MKNLKYFLLTSLLVVFLLSPHLTSAATVEELIAQIKALEQQITQLKAQLAEIQGQTPEWCHDFNVNLKTEDQGEEVAALHIALEKEGFGIFSEEKTGKEFGEATASGISGFQQKYADEILAPLGLRYGTGLAGKATRAKLNKLFGCQAKKAVPIPFCSRVAVICESNSKIVCPAGLNDKGCPFPCKCVPVACTEELKTCPTGNTVSRIPPSCEFAPCPTLPVEETNRGPIIYGISGPTFLKVGERGVWTIKASDPENGSLKYTVEWGDGTMETGNATLSHSFAKAGIYNLTFIIDDNQGNATKSGISVRVGDVAPVVYEQVKCVFKNSPTEQKCYAASDAYYGLGCSGVGACTVETKGTKGDRITWKSSCGGYAYTIIDGQYDYAEFICGDISFSTTLLFPNGGELKIGNTYEIKWKQTYNNPITIELRNKQLVEGYTPWFRMTIVSGLPSKTGENFYKWTVPYNLNPHTGYEVCVSGSAKTSDGSTLFEDCSDVPIYISGTVCTDSDGGENIFVKGTASKDKEQVSDNCQLRVFNGQNFQYNSVSSCSGPDCFVDEGICDSSYSYNTAQGLGHKLINCPTTCRDGLCQSASSVNASIIVVSPNGGELWKLGETHNIQWKSEGLPSGKDIAIELLGSTGTKTLFSSIANDASEVTWTIPKDFAVGTYILKVISYAFSCGGSEKSCGDDSEKPFTVAATTIAKTCSELEPSQKSYFNGCSDSGYDNICLNKFTGIYQGCTKNSRNDCTESNANAEQNILCPLTPTQKTITVLYPNGGENWVIGNTYEIKWTTTGYSADAVVRIIVKDETVGTSAETPIFNVYNKGVSSWGIPFTYEAHAGYKIKIIAPDEKYDESDATFTLLSATTYPVLEKPVIPEKPSTLKDMENFLASISQAVSQIGERIKELGR